MRCGVAFRVLTIFISVLCCFNAYIENAWSQDQDGVIPNIDWQKRLTVSDRLTSFGNDLMGDTIDPNMGSLVFEHADINLPGDSNLEVALRRRLTQGYKYREGVNVEFGDWAIVVPRITAIATTKHGWQHKRCSGTWDESFRNFSWPQGVHYPKDYSDGVSMDIPGQGSQAILKDAFGRITTVNEWYFTCTSASDRNEGFIGHAPNGDRYFFTRVISRSYKRMGYARNSPANAHRVKIFLAATEVRDIHGNSVSYSYDNLDRLIKIESNDGRKINLKYTGNLISSATANHRIWRYNYRDSTYFKPEYAIGGEGVFQGKVLHRVTQPDGLFWSFDLDAMQAEPSPAARTCSRDSHELSLIHPHGVKGKFRIKDIEQRQAYKSYTAVIDNCLISLHREPEANGGNPTAGQGIPPPFQLLTSRSMAVTSKVLSGPSMPTAGWSFSYQQDDPCGELPDNICANYGGAKGSTGNPGDDGDSGGGGNSGSGGGGNSGGDTGPPAPTEEPPCSDANCRGSHKRTPNQSPLLQATTNQSSAEDVMANCEFCFGNIHDISQYVEASPAHIYMGSTAPTHYSNKAYTDAGANPIDFTNATSIRGPEGTLMTYYHLWNFEEGFGGKEIGKITSFFNQQTGTVERLESVRSVYAQFGCKGFASVKTGANVKPGYCPTHQVESITRRNEDRFTREFEYNLDSSKDNYSYGRPVETRSWSSYSISGESNKRITQTTYEHKTDKWILGLPKTVTQNGRLLSKTDYTPLGQVDKVYKYSQTTPVATYTYHADGTLASMTDALNRKTEADNWKRGKPQLVTRAVGTSLEQSHSSVIDDNGWIMSQTDAKNRTTRYQRDSMGRLTRITPHRPPSGQGYKLPDTSIVYTFGDTTIQMITTGPKREFVYYDSLLRPVNELTYDFTTAKRIWTRTKYDALGRPIFKSQPSTVPWEAKGVETEYDALGRVTETRENVAPYATTTHEYLSYHRKKVTDPEGNAVTTYQYGWDGPDSGVPYLIRQHGVTDTWIRRNVHGQIWRVDQNGSSGGFNVNQKQHFYYDAQQRLCRTRTPEGGDTIYRYNEANEMIAYAKGQSAIGYCTSIYDNSAKVSLTYDDLGRLKTTDFADPNTPDIWRDYDANGNMTKNYRGQGTSKEVLWDYTYDGNDMLTDEELVIGGSKAFDIRYKYNANGHMYRKYLPSGRGISYFNDGLGRHIKVSWGTETYADNASYHPSGALETLSFGNGQVFTQELNARLLPKRLRVTKGGADVQNLYYDYYADGRIRHKLDYVDSTHSAIHFYDSAGRLERANSTAWGGAAYKYDALGNLREKRFSNWKNTGSRTVTNNYNSLNRIISSIDTANIGYGFNYDSRGNIRTTGLLNFTYDMSDQPVAMSGTAPNTGTQIDAAYLYDGNMKRVKSVVNGKTIYNVYDLSGRLVHVDEITDGKETDYLHGMGQTLARIKDSGNGDVFTYLHPDHLGSPQVGTTEAGGVRFTEHYTPYGEALLSPAANDNQSGFTGHIKDKDTGLNYMQARYYDPNIGRFLSIDPVTFMDTGNPAMFNRYAYSYNDPVNMFDADGRKPDSVMDRQMQGAFQMGQNIARSPTKVDDAALGLVVAAMAAPLAIAAAPEILAASPHVGGAILAEVSGNAGAVGVAAGVSAKVASEAPDALTTVGRWMSKTEAVNMTKSGMVQESHSGLTHVANPASASTFAKQAPSGSVYTQFDVPSSSLRPSGTGVSSIPGPNAPVKPAPSMPAAQNIKILDEKP